MIKGHFKPFQEEDLPPVYRNTNHRIQNQSLPSGYDHYSIQILTVWRKTSNEPHHIKAKTLYRPTPFTIGNRAAGALPYYETKIERTEIEEFLSQKKVHNYTRAIYRMIASKAYYQYGENPITSAAEGRLKLGDMTLSL